MVVAVHPGVGQGRGGGRPRREGDIEVMHLRLSPSAADRLRTLAKVYGMPAWHVVEWLVLAEPNPKADMEDFRALAPEVREIAKESAAFLEAQADRPAAVKVLRRAWKQTLVLAHHDLQRR